MMAGVQAAALLIAAKRLDSISSEVAVHTSINTDDIKKLIQENTELDGAVKSNTDLLEEIHLHVANIVSRLVRIWDDSRPRRAQLRNNCESGESLNYLMKAFLEGAHRPVPTSGPPSVGSKTGTHHGLSLRWLWFSRIDQSKRLCRGSDHHRSIGDGCIQPSSVDLHIDQLFRVFRNHSQRVIDVRDAQEDLTELIDVVLLTL